MSQLQSRETRPLTSSKISSSKTAAIAVQSNRNIYYNNNNINTNTNNRNNEHNWNRNNNNSNNTSMNIYTRLNQILWTTPPVTKLIIGLCCLIHLGMYIMTSVNKGIHPLSQYGLHPLHQVVNRLHVYLYRFLPSALLHSNNQHLISNMLSVYSIGPILERRFGSIRFFLLTLASALLYYPIMKICLSKLLHVLFHHRLYNIHKKSIGFSGVLFHWLVVACNTGSRNKQSVYGFFEVPSYQFPWVLLISAQILIPNVSFLAHLSGILVGMYPYQFHRQQQQQQNAGFLALIPISTSCLQFIDDNWSLCRYLSTQQPNYIRTTTFMPTASSWTMTSWINNNNSYFIFNRLQQILELVTIQLYYVYKTIYFTFLGNDCADSGGICGECAAATISSSSSDQDDNNDDDDYWKGLTTNPELV